MLSDGTLVVRIQQAISEKFEVRCEALLMDMQEEHGHGAQSEVSENTGAGMLSKQTQHLIIGLFGL